MEIEIHTAANGVGLETKVVKSIACPIDVDRKATQEAIDDSVML